MNLIPDSNKIYNLHPTSKKWKNLYVDGCEEVKMDYMDYIEELSQRLITTREDVRTGKSGVEIGLFEVIDAFLEYINRKDKCQFRTFNRG